MVEYALSLLLSLLWFALCKEEKTRLDAFKIEQSCPIEIRQLSSYHKKETIIINFAMLVKLIIIAASKVIMNGLQIHLSPTYSL